MAIAYPFGLSSVLMTKARTQGASFQQYQPRSGAAYTKHVSTDNPVFFNVTFRFRQVDAQRFFAWFKGPLQEGRLPFTVPMRTEFGLANQEVRFYAAQGDTILDHSQEGNVHTYTGTVFASSLAYPEGVENNWDFVASPFWQYRGEWDLALNSMTPVAKFIELNFASRFYVKNEFIVNLDEVLSFSRGSVGTDFVGGVLTEFGVNEPRVGDGGLLIERSVTNWLLNTDNVQFSLANNSLITRNNEWYQVRKITTGGGATYIYINHTGINGIVPVSQYVCCSCFVKLNSNIVSGNLRLNCRFDGTTNYEYVDFDIANGLAPVVSTSGIISSGSKLISSDVYQIFITLECTVSNASNRSLYIIVPSYNVDNSIQYEVSYPQVTDFAYPLSLVMNESSQLTRMQDNATIDISDISEKSGSYLIEFDNDGIAYGRCIASAYIDNQNSINIYISQSGQIVMIATKSGFSQSVFVSGTPVVGGCRIGVSYSDSSATISVNGVSQSISGDWSNEMQTVALGMDDNGEMHLNSHISYFKFNPESATEYELNQWTGA